MNRLNAELTDLLCSAGASLVGFAELTALPAEHRPEFLPRAIAIACAFDPGIIARNISAPTFEYHAAYLEGMDVKLPRLGKLAEGWLKEHGYQAIYRDPYGPVDPAVMAVPLSHKMVATRAGLGWIGKNGLLVTEEYGPAVLLADVLTDAPITPSAPTDRSRCGNCTACADACPARAIRGGSWDIHSTRDDLLDLPACHRDAKRRTIANLKVDDTICGICMRVCPWVKKNQPGSPLNPKLVPY